MNYEGLQQIKMKSITVLPKPFDRIPSADGIEPDENTRRLVNAQVDALLSQTPSFKSLAMTDQSKIRNRLAYIASYLAELLRDDWAQSRKIGQQPLVKKKINMIPEKKAITAATLTEGNDFTPAAANQVARVTQETLQAIAFPTFVADLLRSTFQAIINSSIQQMEAFGELLQNVSKSVDQFMADNITDNQARDWLTQRYPNLIHVKMEDGQPRIEPTPNADEFPLPDFRSELNIPESISSLDESTLEETLVPAARRNLAQSRLQVLSTLVMMGLQRIVVKHGRIRATMGFHIDASDRVHKEEASLFDTSTSISAAAQFLYFSASATTSITYVRSTKADSDSELNVNADLTGEVDLTFESDYMPLNRFSSAENIKRIRANTPVPENNPPSAQASGTTRRDSADTDPSAASLINKQITTRGRVSAPSVPPIRTGEQPATVRPGSNQAPVAQPDRQPATASPGANQSPVAQPGRQPATARPGANQAPATQSDRQPATAQSKGVIEF